MKRVIRRGVFETNSSSSHSLTLINEDKNSRYKKRDKFNIELKNRDEKVAMFFGLVEHAEETYKLEIDELGKYDDFYDEVKEMIIKRIKEKNNDLLKKYNKKDLELNTLRLIVVNNDINVLDLFDGKEELYLYNNYFGIDVKIRKEILYFKEVVLDVYCELENMSKEEAMKRLRYEANYPSPLKKIFEDSEDVEENLSKYMKGNKAFKTSYENSEEKDLIKFSKEYLLRQYNKAKCKEYGSFYCTRYFGEGSLDDCNCGFESYFEMSVWFSDAFGVRYNESSESMIEAARVFLSDKCKFLGREY